MATAYPPSNDRPGVALVGCGGMGRGDAGAARHFGRVVALCDVDRRQLAEAGKQFEVSESHWYSDFRK
jgi:predicted dehydrogenase